jgi:DNA-binding transcriptional LysR family regulator
MFEKLFAEAGLSLDRLRVLVEVGAAGSIAKAAAGEPVKQSQYSRQLKELEDFFQTKLVERHGKGIRLTPGGRELARISRFFLLGLSNFQRGCLAEEQVFRLGASATFIESFLLPVLARPATKPGPRYAVEVVGDMEIERRLHDLTLDFGIVTASPISRPLQLRELGVWRLRLWAPKALCRSEAQAAEALRNKRLPLALCRTELSLPALDVLNESEPQLSCASFLEARTALQQQGVAAVLPDFLVPQPAQTFLAVCCSPLDTCEFQYRLAWNPRLLRLNAHAGRRRDFLADSLAAQIQLRRSFPPSLQTRR